MIRYLLPLVLLAGCATKVDRPRPPVPAPVPVAQPCVDEAKIPEEAELTAFAVLAAAEGADRYTITASEYLALRSEVLALRPIAKACAKIKAP